MLKFVKIVILSMAVLLSQTAFAMHQIDCLGEQHTQGCELCTTHDNTVDKPVEQCRPDLVRFGETQADLAPAISRPAAYQYYFCRAPPQSL